MRPCWGISVVAAMSLASCGGSTPPDSPELHSLLENLPPPPPPGEHDRELEKLPRPLSVSDAERVLVEATIYAPWGCGNGGRPMQGLAINVLLDQPHPAELLEDVYARSASPGRMLALCALVTLDAGRFANLAGAWEFTGEKVDTYRGCTPFCEPAAEVVRGMTSTSECRDIRKSKDWIRARFE